MNLRQLMEQNEIGEIYVRMKIDQAVEGSTFLNEDGTGSLVSLPEFDVDYRAVLTCSVKDVTFSKSTGKAVIIMEPTDEVSFAEITYETMGLKIGVPVEGPQPEQPEDKSQS